MSAEQLVISAFLYNAAIQEPSNSPEMIEWQSQSTAELEGYQQDNAWQCEKNPKMRSASRVAHYAAVDGDRPSKMRSASRVAHYAAVWVDRLSKMRSASRVAHYAAVWVDSLSKMRSASRVATMLLSGATGPQRC
ncbi:UNVERIFIED_CONTAM: hypothetical protein FKN15_031129 [Acipenser sinensis]